jgi:hypothetical protein
MVMEVTRPKVPVKAMPNARADPDLPDEATQPLQMVSKQPASRPPDRLLRPAPKEEAGAKSEPADAKSEPEDLGDDGDSDEPDPAASGINVSVKAMPNARADPDLPDEATQPLQMVSKQPAGRPPDHLLQRASRPPLMQIFPKAMPAETPAKRPRVDA